MPDPRWIDPELDDLFAGEPELAALAHRLRDNRPEAPLDPRFSSVLRAQLMREAAALRTPVRRERRGWLRRPPVLAWSGAGVGLALVAAAALVIVNTKVQDHTVTAMSPVAELHAVSPDNVITVSFAQPMDEAAVVAGLHIRPATQVSTAWQGNNLLITPTHHLAGNTPYTVTIDRSAARAASGQLAPAAITISFGTAPTPPTAPSVVTLAPSVLEPVDAGAALVAGPGGSVIATSSSATGAGAAASPAAVAAPSSAAQPVVLHTPPPFTHLASPSAAASPAVSPSAPAGAGPSLVEFGSDGTTTLLGPAATAAAASPNGLQVASTVTAASGVQVLLSSVNGTRQTVLTTLSAPALAVGWLDSATVLVAQADRVVSVDLQGRVVTVASLPAGTTSAVLAPGGGAVFAGATGVDGQLVDLGSGAARALPGSRATVAFSGDGSTVAWVDGSGAAPRVETSPVAREAAAIVPLAHPGDAVSDLALDHSGTRLSYVDVAPVARELDVEALPAGTLVARGPAASRTVFLGDGRLAMVNASGQAAVATLPGNPSGSAANVLPDGAAGSLQAFVDAQTAGDNAALAALSGPTVNAAQATPKGLTRSYVISAVANSDGTVAATARLIVDASAQHSLASFADETLTLAPVSNGSGYQVTSLHVGALSDEPVGPHVLHVVPALSSGRLVLQVSFDSDLTASTVAPAIAVTTPDGHVVTATTTYDAETRTATVTADVPASTAVTVTVATSLRDVDGQALAKTFSTVTGG